MMYSNVYICGTGLPFKTFTNPENRGGQSLFLLKKKQNKKTIGHACLVILY